MSKIINIKKVITLVFKQPKYSHFITEEYREKYLNYFDKSLDAWGTEVKSMYIDTSYGKTRVFETGFNNAETLVLIHGFNATSGMWMEYAPELSKKYHCYYIDVIGQLGSSIPEGKQLRFIKNYDVWLKEIVDQLNIDEFSIAGYSYGGNIVARFARKYPKRIKKLLVLEPGMTVSLVKISFLINMFGLNNETMDESIQDFIDVVKPTNEDYMNAIVVGLSTFAQSRFVILLPLSILSWKKLQNKSLLVLAENSELHRSKLIYKYTKILLPKLKTVLVPDTTHALAAQRPDVILENILNFVP